MLKIYNWGYREEFELEFNVDFIIDEICINLMNS